MSNAKERDAYRSMMKRCYDSKHPYFERYGGRGISVCERWRKSINDFLSDMGPSPSLQHSLDRYPNNDGNYEPGNCRWATSAEQARNRSSTMVSEINGEILCRKDFASRLGLTKAAINQRLSRGWSIEKALTEPKRVNQFK